MEEALSQIQARCFSNNSRWKSLKNTHSIFFKLLLLFLVSLLLCYMSFLLTVFSFLDLFSLQITYFIHFSLWKNWHVFFETSSPSALRCGGPFKTASGAERRQCQEQPANWEGSGPSWPTGAWVVSPEVLILKGLLSKWYQITCSLCGGVLYVVTFFDILVQKPNFPHWYISTKCFISHHLLPWNILSLKFCRRV